MAISKTSDLDFINLYKQYGRNETARRLNISPQATSSRRDRLERIHGPINGPRPAPPVPGKLHVSPSQSPARVHYDILNGVALVGSDAHLWPGAVTTAMRAFIKFCGDLKPRAVIMNGDVLDLPKASRHDPLGWEEQPDIADEIKAAQAVLSQIEEAAPNAKLAWTLGNHCARFETRLASIAPEYARIHGFHLKDHFNSRWSPCWAAWINADSATPCVIKHRYKNGINATRANVLHSGTHMVTGHLHAANVRGYNDYRRDNGRPITRWGVDTGCLADPAAQTFLNYTEDGPLDWRSGFAVLTFKDGILLQPELALVFDKNHVQFRGALIRV